jgi:hypothetical protein
LIGCRKRNRRREKKIVVRGVVGGRFVLVVVGAEVRFLSTLG